MEQILNLTDSQQAVVAHNEGPALVFAVAGAGKTTAMVHRIERLVRERIYTPGEILATSFGKGNERDLSHSLSQWPHCRPVQVRTLHALGRQLIVQAQKLGYLQHLRLDAGKSSGDLSHLVLNLALADAWRRQVPYSRELDSLDRQDFLTYVASCKGNLQYASLERVNLPARARKSARQAAQPEGSLGWYLDLYRIYEEIRQKRGFVTFADMLLTGWEALVRYEELLEDVQRSYRCVLVDEFQDINRSQAEILDLITQLERNYMAIGDDDQTIYEWRGASPHFILNFADQYNAQLYHIEDNFRCLAGPLVLANNVIRHNRQRAAKQLQLTKGFAGETAVYRDRNQADMASHIVGRISNLQREGRPLQEIAVLVRLNAQTPYIEQALIAANIPYSVSKPFYHRAEIQTMIHYVRLSWIEKSMQTDKILSQGLQEWFSDAWSNVYNRPKRYLSRTIHDQVRQMVTRQGVLPSDALLFVAPQGAHEGIIESMEQLAEDLNWLATELEQPAAVVLRNLDHRLNYCQFLRESSGFPQTGEGRAASVKAFIEYARGRGSLLDFMQHIRELSYQKIGRDREQQADVVTLSTIHGAKGLEWPVVFVAGCNQEIMPFQAERAENIEEERRLFYVAVTRSAEQLYLHYVSTEPPSQFLREANVQASLPAIRELARVLAQEPEKWEAAQALAIAKTIFEFGLERYFTHWWNVPAEQKMAVIYTMIRFFKMVDAHNGWGTLDLDKKAALLWQQLAVGAGAEKDDDVAFPGLEKLLRSPLVNADRTVEVASEPSAVVVGMWVHCEAGWGRIEQIVDQDGCLLSQIGPATEQGRLYVTLRPNEDGVTIQLDLGAHRIYFTDQRELYTCTKCHAFLSADPHLITSGHNKIVHDGVGARYTRERRLSRPFFTLTYRDQQPDNVLL